MIKSVTECGVYLIVETNNGISFMVDADARDLINSHSWYPCRKRANSSPYIICDVWDRESKRKHKLYLHRLLASPCNDAQCIVDHINGDTLDNRTSNLRIATRAENQRNCKTQHNCESGRKGVRLHKQCGKWQSRITVNDKEIYLGLFNTFEEACAAREKAEDHYFGTFKSYEYRQGLT